jgi:hypothetical protein
MKGIKSMCECLAFNKRVPRKTFRYHPRRNSCSAAFEAGLYFSNPSLNRLVLPHQKFTFDYS